MRRMLMSMAAALFALALPAAAAPRSDRPALLVVVHDETTPPLGAAMLRGVIKEVQAIWNAHMDVEFAAGAAAGRRTTDDVLTLVITDQISGGAREDGLGWIDFVDGEPSKTIHVSRRRAQVLCGRAVLGGRPVDSWPRSVREAFQVHALGRSAAHEIGHYLLRSKEHGSDGLMRAQFTTDDLLQRDTAKFTLNDVELQRLRERFSSYRLARRDPQVTPVQ
jgi:hypothetical protein